MNSLNSAIILVKQAFGFDVEAVKDIGDRWAFVLSAGPAIGGCPTVNKDTMQIGKISGSSIKDFNLLKNGKIVFQK